MAIREIGSVGIRAQPLTNKFRQELQEKLRKIEKSTKVTINTELKGQLEKEAKAEAKEASGETVEFEAHLDDKQARKEFAQLETELERIAQAQTLVLEAQVDRTQLADDLAALRTQLADVQAKIQPVLENADVSAVEVSAIVMKVRLDHSSLVEAEEQIAQWREQIEAQSITIEVETDHNSVGNALQNVSREFGSSMHSAVANAGRGVSFNKQMRVEIDPASVSHIDALIRRIDAELSGKRVVDISTSLVDEDLRKVRRQLKSLRTEVGRERIMLRVDFDSRDSIRGAIKELRNALSEDNSVEIEVGIDRESQLEALRDLQRRLEVAEMRVDVSYDPQSFESVEKAIERIRKRTMGLHPIIIPAELDGQELREELEGLEEQARALERDRLVRFSVDVDHTELSSVEAAINEIRSRMNRPVTIPIDLDDEAAYSQLDNLERTAAELERRREMQFDIEFDPTDLASVEAALQTFEHRARNTIEIPVDLDDESAVWAHIQLANLQSSLQRQARMRKIALDVTLNVSKTSLLKVGDTFRRISGAKMFQDIGADLGKMITQFDELALSIGAVGTVAGGASTAILGMVGGLGSILGDVAASAGALWVLPSFLAAAAIQATVLGVAYRDLSKRLGDLEADFQNLGDLISQNFWASAEQPIRNLVKNQLPELEEGFTSVANVMGQSFGSFADQLDKSLTDRIGPMFDNLVFGINNSRRGTDALADSIAILGSVGSRYLPAFGTWFSDISENFNQFLADAEADGRLQKWIDNGIDSLQDMGHIIGDIGGIAGEFVEIFDRSGFAGLSDMREGLENVREVIESPQFQDGAITVFTGAHKGLEAMNEGIGYAFEQLGGMSDTIGYILQSSGDSVGEIAGMLGDIFGNEEFAAGLQGLFDGINQGLEGMRPMAEELGETLGLLMDAAGGFLGAVGEELGEFEELGLVVNDILRELEPLATELVHEVGDALQTMMPSIANLVDSLLPVLVELFEGLGDALGPLADALSPVIDLLAWLVDILGQPIAIGFTALVNGASTLLAVVSDLATGDWEGAKQHLKDFEDTVNKTVFGDDYKGHEYWDSLESLDLSMLEEQAKNYYETMLGIEISDSEWRDKSIAEWEKYADELLKNSDENMSGIEEIFSDFGDTVNGENNKFWNDRLRKQEESLVAEEIMNDIHHNGMKSDWFGYLDQIQAKNDEMMGLYKSDTERHLAGTEQQARLHRLNEVGGWQFFWDTINGSNNGFWGTFTEDSNTGATRTFGLTSEKRKVEREGWDLFWTTIKGENGNFWDRFKDITEGGLNGTKGSQSRFFGESKVDWDNYWSDIKSDADKAAEDFQSIGESIINGLIDGFNSRKGLFAQTVQETIASAAGKTRQMMEINSPSRVTARDGKWIALGYVKGVEDNKGKVENAFSSLMQMPTVPKTPVTANISALTQASAGTGFSQTNNITMPRTDPALVFGEIGAAVSRQRAMSGIRFV